MLVTSRNYPLYLGSVLAICLVALAIFGPALAPRDPYATLSVQFVGNNAFVPPFGPLRVPGFPLGTDEQGRDLLSRILWAVRPTLMLCTIIAVVRVALGVLLGLLAGWIGGLTERVIEALISVCVVVPILIFAVGAIKLIGIERGLFVFIVALCATGWAATAGLVKHQMLTVLHAPYIESARAIGVPAPGILRRHVLRQLWPLLPMLLAFELSAVTLLVAELGFLGLFIGGGAIVGGEGLMVELNAEFPELAQMLSRFWTKFYRSPFEFLLVGGILFVMLVAFNLLGEGLRRRLDVTRPHRIRWRFWQRATIPAGSEWTPGGARWPGPVPDYAALLAVAGLALVVILGIVAVQNRTARGDGSAAALSGSPVAASIAASAIAPGVIYSTAPVAADQLAQIDLQTLVWRDGDLPKEFSKARVSDRPPYYFGDAPPAAKTLDLGVDRRGLNAGSITVLLYPSIADRDRAYDSALKLQDSLAGTIQRGTRPGDPTPAPPTPEPAVGVPGLGERSRLIREFAFNGTGTPVTTGVMFTRCAAVLLIRFQGVTSTTSGSAQPPPVVAYARQLEQRLTPLVCRPQ